MKQVLIALDQLINTLLFFFPGGAWADETISARSWRLRHIQPFKALRPAIDAMFFLNRNHCQESYLAEKMRQQSPPSER
jgi:hypothetical protein